MIRRLAIAAVVAACGLALVSEPADARPWRRGWGGPGWGGYYPYAPYGPYGPWGWNAWPPLYDPSFGYYYPGITYYVPPLVREPAVVLPRKRCAAGRVPARWVKAKVDGRIVYRHVMSRCR